MADRTSTQPENTAADQNKAAFRLTTQEWIVVVLIAFSIIRFSFKFRSTKTGRRT
jgi:hypothetical protein